LVGWRVEGDVHVVRSLWHRRGHCAYLNRNAIHATMEAAIGFKVKTVRHEGIVVAYVNGGPTLTSGRFLVKIQDDGICHGQVLEFDRSEIISCHGSQFMPIIEHIREAATYQIQVDNYNAALRDQNFDETASNNDREIWRVCTICLEILWRSFLKAVDEDKDFDEGVNEFLTDIIDFLERLDENAASSDETCSESVISGDFEIECVPAGDLNRVEEEKKAEDANEPGFWMVNEMFGGIFILSS
jgi:hypothetical protein